jgi:hypothetical protein
MKDARRYRMNAAECLSAAGRCEPAYRDLTFAIAEAWLSLACQQESMVELLAIWTEARSGDQSALKPLAVRRRLHGRPRGEGYLTRRASTARRSRSRRARSAYSARASRKATLQAKP